MHQPLLFLFLKKSTISIQNQIEDTEPRYIPPKGKTVTTYENLGLCLSLMMRRDSVIGRRSFHLDAITNPLLKDKHVIILANYTMMICFDFWFIACFEVPWTCFVIMTFEMFYLTNENLFWSKRKSNTKVISTNTKQTIYAHAITIYYHACHNL